MFLWDIPHKKETELHTLNEFLDYMASRFGTGAAYKWIGDGATVSKSFIDLRDDALRTSAELNRCFGTQKKIALIGEMSYSWICVWYGIITGGNISVPLDTKLSPEELAERLNFADVSIVFLSERFAVLEETIRRLCDKVTVVQKLEDYPGCLSAERSGSFPATDPDALASLMFTSGTSGDGLKAAMITQRGILADVTGPVPLCVPGDRLLSLLPIHHCFEIFVGQMKYLYLGATICINDSMANLIPNLTRFGITIVVAVPALANMLAAFIAQGLKTHSINEVKQMLGGKLRRITIGGASASKEVIDTLGLAGITVFVGYGLTESTGGCLANCDASIRPREAGGPYVEGMEMKLEDGELCLKGPMIMQGYYKSPELTAKVLENGWFHTGDLAEITDEGYVIIRGRKDNMIKTPNGEKIYPEVWESRLSMIEGVSAGMVASVNNHLTAILFLKEDTPDNRKAVVKRIDEINGALPGYERIMDVRFREKPFPMTTSMKIKRREVIREISRECRNTGSAAPEDDFQQQILEKVMQVLPDGTSTGIDDNLYERGLDSLSTINLSILLDCPAETIYAAKTIRRLSELLKDGTAVPERYDTGHKIEGINRYIAISPAAPAGLGKTVLLTGAGGYLGAHILNELIRQGHQVFCLVRNEEKLDQACRYYGFEEARKKAGSVIGDITKDHLGLSDTQYTGLCSSVDAVIHAAALVSHVGSEETSSLVNVGGTKEVIRFCAASGAALFHISTYAVSGFGINVPLTEDKLDIGQEIGSNPYVQTKYQAEEQVLMARAQGIPSTIFRVGNLSARSSDGLFQINAEANGMAAQLRAIRKLGCYPESMRDVPYDSTPVDKAANAIVLLAKEDGTGHIWHIMSTNISFLSRLTDGQMVSDEEFAEMLAKRSEDRDTAILSVYYRMAKAGFNTNFDFGMSQEELNRLGFVWD